MPGQKRERSEERDLPGGLHVAVTAHQLLAAPVLQHRVIPTLLCRTVAQYLPVVITAPERTDDVTSYEGVDTLQEIVKLMQQRRDANRRQKPFLTTVLSAALVPSDPTATDGKTKKKKEITGFPMDAMLVDIARAELPAAVTYERYVTYSRTGNDADSGDDDDNDRSGFFLSVVIEGMRVVAMGVISGDESEVQALHFFALAPAAAAPFEFDGCEIAHSQGWNCTWKASSFESHSTYENLAYMTIKTNATGTLEGAGAAARPLLFTGSPLSHVSNRELGVLIALAVTVDPSACSEFYAPGLIQREISQCDL